jgi:hypothetical protein
MLAIPGIYGPDFTSQNDGMGTWMDIAFLEVSPEGVSLCTLTVTTKIFISVAGSFSGTTVGLPK